MELLIEFYSDFLSLRDITDFLNCYLRHCGSLLTKLTSHKGEGGV